MQILCSSYYKLGKFSNKRTLVWINDTKIWISHLLSTILWDLRRYGVILGVLSIIESSSIANQLETCVILPAVDVLHCASIENRVLLRGTFLNKGYHEHCQNWKQPKTCSRKDPPSLNSANEEDDRVCEIAMTSAHFPNLNSHLCKFLIDNALKSFSLLRQKRHDHH